MIRILRYFKVKRIVNTLISLSRLHRIRYIVLVRYL